MSQGCTPIGARNIDYNTRKARARKKWVQPELATRVPDPGCRSGGKFKSLDGVIVLVLAVQDLVAVEPEPHGQGAPEHCPHGQGEPEPEPEPPLAKGARPGPSATGPSSRPWGTPRWLKLGL